LVIQCVSKSGTKVYIKESGENKTPVAIDLNSDAGEPDENAITKATKESFGFHIIVNGLKSGLVGKLNDYSGQRKSLRKITFVTEKEFENYRLIDYVAKHDNFLSARFLSLWDWNLNIVNGAHTRTLEIAAEHASVETLTALLDLQLPLSAEKIAFPSSKVEILNLHNNNGNTPLLIAAAHGKTENVCLLLRCGIDVNFQNHLSRKKAIDLAWENKHYSTVVELLQADSDFPKPSETKLLDENFKRKHEILSLYILLGNELFQEVSSDEEKQNLDGWIKDIKSGEKTEGIIQIIDNEPHFIHITFAEYFASFPIVEKLMQDSTKALQIINSMIKNTSPVFIKSIMKQLDTKESRFSDLLDGKTLLNLAAQKGCLNVVKSLLEGGYYDYPKPDSLDKTPLHHAAEFGQSNVVQYLLMYYSSSEDTFFEDGCFKKEEYVDSNVIIFVNKKDKDGNTALYYAAKKDNMEIACDLLLIGAESKALGEYMKSVTLFVANKMHNFYAGQDHKLRPLLEKLLLEVPEAVSKFSEYYEYPRLLSHFFVHGRIQVIQALMNSLNDEEKKKRLLNAKDNSATPLDRVNGSDQLSDEERLTITKYLFENGGTKVVNSPDTYITQILLPAAHFGHINTLKYFIDKADRKYFSQILNVATKNQQFHIVKYLLKHH